MSDGKGKGRVKGDENNENPEVSEHGSQTSNSMLARLTASAAGLAQSTFTAPSSSELSDRASAAISSTGKIPQAGGSHSSAWAESSKASKQPTLNPLHRQLPSSFRAGHSEEHTRSAEAEFSSFLDGIDSFTPSLEAHGEPGFTPGLGAATPLGGAELRTDTVYGQYEQAAYNSVDEQQRHDGEDVLAILSKPSAMSDEEILQVEDEDINWNLTDQQISKLRTIMKDLFPPAELHVPQQIDHPLNLVPPMVSTSAISGPSSMAATDEDNALYFGANIPRETARQTWMSQWESVLTRYTDEVWGNLLPLVTEARKEIEVLKEEPAGDSTEIPKALRRLHLVLDHLRKS